MRKKLLVFTLILAFTSNASFCQSEQLVINFPPASLPGLLTFENPKGSIKVTGYEGAVILVTGTLRFRDAEKYVESGMRRIDQNSVDISAEVNGNNVTLLCRTTGKTVDFDIKVPGNFSLKLKSLDNGTIEIFNITGEIEVENSDGDISLENISGSAVLSSVYGKISASFSRLKPETPMMFTSFEGDISVTFPVATNATLKLKSDKGGIYSDFDIKPVRRQPVERKVDDTRIYSLEDWTAGSINSEGPEYIMKTYNGNIYIRKK